MEAISGTSDSFELIFRQHYQRLCSYAYTFLKDTESSEDLVQDVFIKIWENGKYQIGADNIKYYLFTAVRNNCLTLIQKNKRNAPQQYEVENAAAEISIQIDPKESGTDPKMLISKALDQLPPKCREVFMLSRLSGLTYRQIADTMGISIKTVENQMGKAIGMMKTFAKENGIYAAMLYFIFFEINTLERIGVLLERWFY